MLTYFVYHLRVSSVRSELIKHEGVEKTHVACHLLHTSQLSFFFCISEFNH